jgi:hypothetical protein
MEITFTGFHLDKGLTPYSAVLGQRSQKEFFIAPHGVEVERT